jgi:Tol biopolymer transport system component
MTDMTDIPGRLSASLADRYRIERELGAGGMATVYLAHDVRHDRKVALKVLRPELAAILGGERFLSEIKTTANLQHPHILSLFDSGEADGLVFYVMPYVEGESLRDRLTREKQLPVEDAVRIAREVADALEYAHTQGVVHRDIKPENILLHGGHAMVADFGIALAASRSEGATRMTETGMSLGTPAYMSPEQAMGQREITPKADIYALGATLYEMLSGEPPFVGPTAQAIIARVMTEEPRALTLHRHTIPPHVEAAVRKALEKLPADRFTRATQFAEALANPAFTPGRVASAAGVAAPTGGWWRRSLAAAPWLLLAAVSALAAGAWYRSRGGPPAPVMRFRLDLDSASRFTETPGNTIALSPDGARMVYTGGGAEQRRLYLRSLDRIDAVAIPGTQGASQPFFSPDGLWVSYLDEHDQVVRVALPGGNAVPICRADSGLFGASWGDRGTIVLATDKGLRQVPASGGEPRPLTMLDTTRELSHNWPEVLPGGAAALFTIRGKDGTDRLAAVALQTGEITRFAMPGSDPHYVATGHVVLARAEGGAVAVPFDARRLRVTGQAVPLVQDVAVWGDGTADLGVSHSGVLIYATGQRVGERSSLVLVDRSGAVRPLTAESRDYFGPRFSPDGRRIAVTIYGRRGLGAIYEGNGTAAIWIFDVAQKTLTRLTFDSLAQRAFWTADGRRLGYTRGSEDRLGARLRWDVAWIAADGSAPAESLPVPPGDRTGDGLTPDGRTLVWHKSLGSNLNDIWLLSTDGSAPPRPYMETPANEAGPVVSPDGRWIAYASNESGRYEIYVRPFPTPGAKVQVSLGGGLEPVWSRDGRELFYRDAEAHALISAVLRTQPAFTVLERRELFRGAFKAGMYFADYDVAPDGRRVVMVQGSPAPPSELVVVLNWFDHVGRGAAPTAGR